MAKFSQYEFAKEQYQRMLKEGLDPNSVTMRCLKDKIAGMERTQWLKTLSKEDPETYRFLMSGPNIHEK